MPHPLISIFIPTYNRAQYLKGTIESCLHQDTDNYEIFIADDGSTDETLEVVRGLKRDSDKIRYMRLENNTKGQKIYYLARQIKGRFIFRIGDDDLLYPNILGRYTHALKTTDARFFYGDIHLFSDDQTVDRIQVYKDFYEKRDDLLLNLLHGNCFPMPGSMLDMDLYWRHLTRVGYPGFHVSTYGTVVQCAGRAIDYLEWVLLAGTGHPLKHVGTTTVKYRVHPQQDSNPMFKNGSEESFVVRMILALHSIKEISPKSEWEKAPDISEARFILNLGHILIGLFDTQNALLCYESVLSFQHLPSVLLEEAVIAYVKTVFAKSTRVSNFTADTTHIKVLCKKRKLKQALEVVDKYERLADIVTQRIDHAISLKNNSKIDEAKSILEETIRNQNSRTSAGIKTLSEVCSAEGNGDLSYHYAIFAAALSGYSNEYCQYALQLSTQNNNNEITEMRKRTLIQPFHLMRGRYPFDLPRDDFEEIEKINDKAGRFYMKGEVETLGKIIWQSPNKIQSPLD